MAVAIVPVACWLMLAVTQGLGDFCHTTTFDQLEILPHTHELSQPSPVTDF